MFKGRKLLIATKHKKENVLAPILEKELGVKCVIPEHFNTDQFGTFSGEIEREDDPVATARKKCLKAMQLYNCDLAIASEGSFGPHPSIYFIPADDEFLIFIDKKNDIEIIARDLSTETNFNGSIVNTEDELFSFAKRTNFPSHGLILRKEKDDFTEIVKGIITTEQLKKAFNHFINSFGTVYVETDMRAMYNPTRMKIIERAATKLITKINTLCPHCNTPGFGITDAKKGLPCSNCNFPTRSILCYIHSCKKCKYSKEEKYPNNKHFEEPTYCDICNP